MKAFAIDPGPLQSAFVLWDGKQIEDKGIIENIKIFEKIYDYREYPDIDLVIEMIASYGMSVGKDVFQTVFWIGRFYERWVALGRYLMERKDVKLHLCHDSRAKDSNIVTALIDRFDPMRKFGKYGKGTKKNPGPLYGLSKDLWQALALAIVWFEKDK